MIAMVVVGLILMVGLQVSASFQITSAATNYGSAANNATAALVFTNTFQGYNLMALLPYVIAAGAIITVVLVVFSLGGGRPVQAQLQTLSLSPSPLFPFVTRTTRSKSFVEKL